jgi:hypothetical protein
MVNLLLVEMLVAWGDQLRSGSRVSRLIGARLANAGSGSAGAASLAEDQL